MEVIRVHARSAFLYHSSCTDKPKIRPNGIIQKRQRQPHSDRFPSQSLPPCWSVYQHPTPLNTGNGPHTYHSAVPLQKSRGRMANRMESDNMAAGHAVHCAMMNTKCSLLPLKLSNTLRDSWSVAAKCPACYGVQSARCQDPLFARLHVSECKLYNPSRIV